MKMDSTIWKYAKLVEEIANEFGFDYETAKNIVCEVAYDKSSTLTEFFKDVDFDEDEECAPIACDEEDSEEYDEDEEYENDEDDEDEDWEDNDDINDDDNEEDSEEYDDDNDGDEQDQSIDDVEKATDSQNRIRIPALFMRKLFNAKDLSTEPWEECSVFYHDDENKISIGIVGTFDYIFSQKNHGTIHNYTNYGINAEWGFNLRLLKSIGTAATYKWFTIHYNENKNLIEITW